MSMKKFNFKTAVAILSLLVLISSSVIFADSEKCSRKKHRGWHVGEKVEPAQANYQDETSLTAVSDDPIPFTERNFRTNFRVNDDHTVFQVEIPGLYSLDSFLIVNVPNIGDSVDGYITINGRKLLTFYNQEVRTAANPIEFHFGDRLVYLRKGDRISIILSQFPAGTTILARGLVLIAYNNSL